MFRTWSLHRAAALALTTVLVACQQPATSPTVSPPLLSSDVKSESGAKRSLLALSLPSSDYDCEDLPAGIPNLYDPPENFDGYYRLRLYSESDQIIHYNKPLCPECDYGVNAHWRFTPQSPVDIKNTDGVVIGVKYPVIEERWEIWGNTLRDYSLKNLEVKCWLPGYGPNTPPSTSPSASISPSSAPSPTATPNPEPSDSPKPLAIRRVEASKAFSPNDDQRMDAINLAIASEKNWTLTVDGYSGVLASGPGKKDGESFLFFNGRLNNSALPDGQYTLRVTSGQESAVTDVIIDRKKPQISISSIYSKAWSSDGRSLVIAGKASIQDVGLAGLNPTLSKLNIDGYNVSSAKTVPSQDGKTVDFEFSVSPVLRTAYRLSAVGDESQSTTVAINVEGSDLTESTAGRQFSYQFTFAPNINGMIYSGQLALVDAPKKEVLLPEVQKEAPASGLDDWIFKLLRSARGGPFVGAVVFAMDEGTDYVPAQGAPPPPPPRNPKPKPGPDPSPSPSPSPPPFENGKLWQFQAQSENGYTIYFDAMVKIEGRTLVLEDILMTANNGFKSNTIGPGAFQRMKDSIMDIARSRGYEFLKIIAERPASSTTAKPGKSVEFLYRL